MKDNYQNKKALVLGLGLSGRAAVAFLMRHGASVYGIDRNQALLQEHADVLKLKQLGLTVGLEDEVTDIDEFDLVVVSPGISQTHPIYRKAQEADLEILGEIELGCRSVSNPIIGITGTNGKTTVTFLVTHILNQTGKKARALGNVGAPLTQELLNIEPHEILVLELSSYQLETFYQPVLDAAVILNITPDHLDRYASMEEYAKSKLLTARCLKEKSPLYIEEQTAQTYHHLLKNISHRTYGYSPNCWLYTDGHTLYWRGKQETEWPLSYKGKRSHDLENSLAAYALCREFGVHAQPFMEALQTFKKPAHRIQFVGEKQGVYYYDDSKGTNIDAVIRAVQSLPGPIILIAGGVDKGAAYTPWLDVFANKVKYICAIGQAAGKMQSQLSHQIPVKIFTTLEQAVRQASQLAVRGDYVLLSPGCSSFDMFKDYAQRGEEFQRVVRQL